MLDESSLFCQSIDNKCLKSFKTLTTGYKSPDYFTLVLTKKFQNIDYIQEKSSLLCHRIGDKEKCFKTMTTCWMSLAYFTIALKTNEKVLKR